MNIPKQVLPGFFSIESLRPPRDRHRFPRFPESFHRLGNGFAFPAREMLLMLILMLFGPLAALGQGTLANGGRHAGEIVPAGDADSWTFTAAAGDSIVLRVGATNFTPRIRLYGPNNALMEDVTAGNSLARDGVVTSRAVGAGTHTVVVSAAFATQSGSYALYLAVAPGEFTTAADDEGGELRNGAAQAGTLTLGDLDIWRFSASAGEGFMLRMGSATLTPWIQLYGPDGSLVSETTSGNTLARDGFLTLSATNSGTYTVVASATYPGQTGSYTLHLAAASQSFIVSPSDEGGELVNGASNSGSITVGDLDMWSFSATAGNGLMLRVGATTFTPWIRLYGPAGTLIGETKSGNSLARDGFLTLSATNAGTYTVVVSATVGGQAGDYTIHLAAAPQPVTVSPGDQGGELTNGADHPGTLIMGDLDVWNFSATSGDGLMLRVGASSFTPWIRVYGPDGALAGETTSGNNLVRDGVVALSATNTGNYTVVVSATFAGQTGNYTLHYTRAPGQFVVSEEDEGGELTNGVIHYGTIPVGDLDMWSFSASSGDGLIIRMGATNVTPWIRLYGPDGSLIAEETSGNSLARDGVLALSATNSGTYTVVAGAYYAGQTGTYALNLAVINGDFTGAGGDEGGSMLNGFSHSANLSMGDIDVWSFVGTRGDSNVLQVVSTGFTPWIRLYSPDGSLVKETTSGNTLVRTGTLIHEITDNPGLYTVVVTATYPGQSGTYTFKQSRWAPDLNVPDTQIISESETLNVSISAQDPNEPVKPLEFKLLSGPPGVQFAIAGSTNATITWATSELDGPSTNTIVASVTDVVNGRSFSRTNSFTVIVQEINMPPQLTIPANQTLDELTPLNVSASATDVDIPENPLAFSLVSPPAGMTINPETGAISWTPTEAQGPSTNLITVVVTDSNPWAANATELSVTNSFTVTVREVNLPPHLVAPANQTLNETETLNVAFGSTDDDLPANTLTFSLVNAAPEGLVLNPATGAISWTPTEAQGPSTNVITVQVQDNGTPSLSATRSFTVIVNEVNAPPTLPAQVNRSINELVTLVITNTATDVDLPANTLTYTLAAAPTNATISANGIITWTPTEEQGPSTNTFTTIVTDNGSPALSATNTFVVAVNEVNLAPTLESIVERSVHFGTPISINASASDADIPANTLTFSLEQVPAGMTIDSTTGLITWTPAQDQVGDYTVQVRVTDNGSPALSATVNLAITVTGEGSSLAITPLKGGLMQLRITGDIGLTYELQVSTNLIQWERALEFRLNSSPQIHVDPDSAANPIRFYRLFLKQ